MKAGVQFMSRSRQQDHNKIAAACLNSVRIKTLQLHRDSWIVDRLSGSTKVKDS